LFVVLLIEDPSSQELGPPAIPGRFSLLEKAPTHQVVCYDRKGERSWIA